MMKFTLILALLLTYTLPASPQQAPEHRTLNLVAPTGKGRIVIPANADGVQWEATFLYDQNTRPVFQTKNTSTGLVVSYALFPNRTGSSSPNVCRDDIVSAGIRSLTAVPEPADIKQKKKTDHAPIHGQPIAVGEYFVKSVLDDVDLRQQNMFIVAASPTLCAEMHVSKTPYQPSDEPLLTAQAESFTFDPDYTPSTQDYAVLGSVFYQHNDSYEAAAVYYQRAHDTLPPNAPLTLKRYLTDQLAMSYGISGQLKQSRAVNEDAIKTDPDYPLYYYNLACADAEQGHPDDAKLHLQQAFDRKANTLPGETMPDPTKDDSFLKLKKNKDFWTFLQTLK